MYFCVRYFLNSLKKYISSSLNCYFEHIWIKMYWYWYCYGIISHVRYQYQYICFCYNSLSTPKIYTDPWTFKWKKKLHTPTPLLLPQTAIRQPVNNSFPLVIPQNITIILKLISLLWTYTNIFRRSSIVW